jgi:hypothetical protein
MKTCESCQFYTKRLDVRDGRWTECTNLEVEDAIHVTVADDHNLSTSFRPRPTFGCVHHVERP